MASNSKFVSNLKIWLFVIPILMITVMPFINLAWIYTIDQSEIESNIYIFGLERHSHIEADADSQFSRWFVKSGFYASSTKSDRTGGGSLELGKVPDEFVNNYFTNLWKMVYRAMYRLNVAWEWMVGAILLIGAAMYDGWQQRNIKRHTFGYSNPMAFHLITHAIFITLGLAIALCFFPMAIKPVTWVIGILAVSLFGWKMMESFQTGS